jgi:hypothetical protein
MQDRIIMSSFMALCKTPIPAEITRTIASINGSVIQFTQTIGNEADWVGAVVEITSGVHKGHMFAIANNTVDSVICAGSKFTVNYTPAVGDTVKIHGGPLYNTKTRFYIDDPDSVKADIENDIKFFIVLNSVEGDVSFKTLAGQTRSGEGRLNDFYGFEFTVETKYVTGTPTKLDVVRVSYELPLLRDQILSLLFNFVLNPENRVQLADQVSWARVLIHRPGMPNPTRAYTITFDLGVL